ncbi:MAG: 3-dehydroquinate synthase [Halobacteriovoraceae bacterium]|nr:3-dehydroquinate synthase [Halobacteriovoraceae bacterium]
MKTEIKIIEKEKILNDIDALDTDLILVVVDSRVWQLYGKDFENKLPSQKNFILFKSLEGEKTKCFEEFESGLEFFLEKGIHRNAHLVAIGGGATSDFAGYIAASILRGISWSIVPTTILSMVDASIGGKTGINSKHGKNLVGAFHMPDRVWIDDSFLSTLDRGEYKSGLGEILKYGFLDENVTKLLEGETALKKVIEACAKSKERIVQEDFKESGVRISLNLGHTYGHALEKIYDLSHGEAVFWGMALIFKLHHTKDEKNVQECLSYLRTWSKNLGVDFGDPPWLNKTFPVAKIMNYLSKDKKKASSGTVKIVKVKELGKFSTETISLESIKTNLEERANELRTFNF